MPFKCAVFGCKGNYDTGQKVSIFSFPKDMELKSKWIQRLMRKNFKPSSSSRVCELHFRKEDILREVQFFDKRAGKLLKSQLLYPRLKKGAIPSLSPLDCPSHLQPTTTTSRESPDSKRRRFENSSVQKAIEDSHKTQQQYEKTVTFSSLPELLMSLQRQNVDDFWTICYKADYILIMHISVETVEVICSIIVDRDLNVTLIYRKVSLQKLGKSNFPSKVSNSNILFDIMSSLKMLSDSESNSHNDMKNICDVLIILFEKLKTNINLPKSNIKFIDFSIEQLIKMNVAKYQRRHSPDLLVFCSLLKSISPHCYKFLRNSEYFILPNPGTLRRICSEFSINPSDEQIDENFLTYIKQKFTCLNEKEKFITLMIDEIHLKSNFDYVGGKLTGMAFNVSEAASSAYIFMVQSTAENFYSFIKKVVIGLEKIGYNVIAIITDNNAINRKAMEFFSTPPKLSIMYKNPAYPERPLFFLIDSVHIY